MKNLFWRLSVLTSVGSMLVAAPALAGQREDFRPPGQSRRDRDRVVTSTIPRPSHSTTTVTTTPPVRDVDLVCMQKAVEKRETAIIAAFDKFAVAKKQTLEKRKIALLDAWKIVNRQERRTALRTAWQNYRKESQTAREAFHKTRREAWAQFKNERKACGKNAHADEPANEGDDAQI